MANDTQTEALEAAEPYLYEAPLVVETHTPLANLATRDNIVPDGPGTVGDELR